MVLKEEIMVKITMHKLMYWPFTKEQYTKILKPAKILFRIKLAALFLIIFALYGFYIKQYNIVISAFIGGIAAIIFGIYFYKAVKSGKIKFEIN